MNVFIHFLIPCFFDVICRLKCELNSRLWALGFPLENIETRSASLPECRVTALQISPPSNHLKSHIT